MKNFEDNTVNNNQPTNSKICKNFLTAMMRRRLQKTSPNHLKHHGPPQLSGEPRNVINCCRRGGKKIGNVLWIGIFVVSLHSLDPAKPNSAKIGGAFFYEAI